MSPTIFQYITGGSVLGIMQLLSSHSLKPIVWAILIFSPFAWFAMNWWLESFQYRITISPFVFVGSAVVILSVALLTIGWQTYLAARANPIESIKSE